MKISKATTHKCAGRACVSVLAGKAEERFASPVRERERELCVMCVFFYIFC